MSETPARKPQDESLDAAARASDSGTRPTASADHLAELLASISHDLRTPLGIIMGAFREVRNTLPPESQAYGRLVDRSTDKLVQLAERLARAGAVVGGRGGEVKRSSKSSPLLRDAALRAQARSDVALRLDPGEEVDVALDGPRATDAFASLLNLADPAADPAVSVARADGAIEVHIALRTQPATGHDLERSFGRTGDRARINLDLYFARLELESQGCAISFAGKELVVRVPIT